MGLNIGALGIADIRYGDGSIPRIYRGGELLFGEPPTAPPVEPFIESVVIPASAVTADLTGFPLLVDLANLSDAFWYNVKADGADIRAYDVADSPIPFDVIAIDKVARTGAIFIRTNLATASPTLLKIEVGYPERSALAASDTYGQYAVWADYEAVYFFLDNLEDRTSHARNLTVKTGTAAYAPAPLGASGGLDTGGANFQASIDNLINPSAVYTMAASVTMDLNTSENQQAMTFCQTYGSSSNRSTIGNRNAGGVFTTFSADDSWLDGSVVGVGTPERIAATYNGSTARKLFLDGALAATDNTITSKTMDTLTIGGGSASGAYWRGRIGFAYLRLEILSDAWLEAEANNLRGTLSVPTVESLWGATT